MNQGPGIAVLLPPRTAVSSVSSEVQRGEALMMGISRESKARSETKVSSSEHKENAPLPSTHRHIPSTNLKLLHIRLT